MRIGHPGGPGAVLPPGASGKGRLGLLLPSPVMDRCWPPWNPWPGSSGSRRPGGTAPGGCRGSPGCAGAEDGALVLESPPGVRPRWSCSEPEAAGMGGPPGPAPDAGQLGGRRRPRPRPWPGRPLDLLVSAGAASHAGRAAGARGGPGPGPALLGIPRPAVPQPQPPGTARRSGGGTRRFLGDLDPLPALKPALPGGHPAAGTRAAAPGAGVLRSWRPAAPSARPGRSPSPWPSWAPSCTTWPGCGRSAADPVAGRPYEAGSPPAPEAEACMRSNCT